MTFESMKLHRSRSYFSPSRSALRPMSDCFADYFCLGLSLALLLVTLYPDACDEHDNCCTPITSFPSAISQWSFLEYSLG